MTRRIYVFLEKNHHNTIASTGQIRELEGAYDIRRGY